MYYTIFLAIVKPILKKTAKKSEHPNKRLRRKSTGRKVLLSDP